MSTGGLTTIGASGGTPAGTGGFSSTGGSVPCKSGTLIHSGSSVYPNDPSYENQAGKPVTEACLGSTTKHLLELANQSVANVESVHRYEMWDEADKAVPENRFGLMFDLDTPKVHLFLASAFRGGALTVAESSELTSRGLLGTSQIASFSPCGAGGH